MAVICSEFIYKYGIRGFYSACTHYKFIGCFVDLVTPVSLVDQALNTDVATQVRMCGDIAPLNILIVIWCYNSTLVIM